MEKFSYRNLLRVAPWIVTVIAVTLLVFRSDTSAQRPIVVNPGRYQLVNGESGGIKTLIKIDTETGATWFILIDEKNAVQGWVSINNLVRQQ